MSFYNELRGIIKSMDNITSDLNALSIKWDDDPEIRLSSTQLNTIYAKEIEILEESLQRVSRDLSLSKILINQLNQELLYQSSLLNEASARQCSHRRRKLKRLLVRVGVYIKSMLPNAWRSQFVMAGKKFTSFIGTSG